MKIIAVISYPRTGSSLLIHKLKCYPVTALLEIFHSSPAVAKRHLEIDPILRATPAIIDGYTREAVIDDPLGFIDAVAQLKSQTDALIFKLFPGHLPSHVLETIISKSDSILIHTRNRLHSFISDLIAARLRSWGGTSTSDQYVSFCPTSFLDYSARIHEFLSYAIKLAIDSKTPILFSCYETLASPLSCDMAIQAMLSQLLGAKAVVTNPSPWIPQRQDSRLNASHKVTNSETLIDFLVQNQVLFLDNGLADLAFSQYPSLRHAPQDHL